MLVCLSPVTLVPGYQARVSPPHLSTTEAKPNIFLVLRSLARSAVPLCQFEIFVKPKVMVALDVMLVQSVRSPGFLFFVPPHLAWWWLVSAPLWSILARPQSCRMFLVT